LSQKILLASAERAHGIADALNTAILRVDGPILP